MCFYCLDNKGWRKCEAKGTLTLLSGNLGGVATLENNMEAKKLETELPYDPATLLLAYIQRKA